MIEENFFHHTHPEESSNISVNAQQISFFGGMELNDEQRSNIQSGCNPGSNNVNYESHLDLFSLESPAYNATMNSHYEFPNNMEFPNPYY